MRNFIFLHKEFLIGLVLTLSLFWPLFVAPFFTHHDDVQIIRLYEMDKCFKDGQFPCRWVPDLGGLYGYPIFNYYAPLPYYLGEIFYLLTHSLIVSVKIMFAFSFLGAYVFMYLLAKRFWGKLGGAASAIFYTFAPYHALDFYIRGAMGEMWGLMLFPAIFWALVRLEEKTNIRNLVLTSVFIFALLISHNLSALIFLPLALIWVLVLFFKNERSSPSGKNRKLLLYSFLSLILGTSLSGFYLLPVIFEKSLVHVETTTYGYFHYTEHFKGFKKLFLERMWGYGASIREVPGGERDGISFQIGWIHLLGWFISLFVAWRLWNKNRFLSVIIIASSVFILYACFMINPRSEFIWNAVEPLKYLQFPWRFLMIVIFFISFITGSVYLVTPKKWLKILWSLLISLVVLANFSYFGPEKFIQTSDQELLTGKNWDRQIKRSIFDYLPIYAKAPPAELATKRFEILTGNTNILDYKEGTNWIKFSADTKTHTIIRLSQYYFPEWKIFVDGKEIQIDYKNNDLGLMTFILGSGHHEIYAKLFDTQIRSISNVLSSLGFLILIFLIFISSRRARKWITYYRRGIN